MVLGALRLYRFTLIRDGDVLRISRGLLGKQAATISVERIQAVRIVEGFWRMLLGYCSLQVEVAGIGRANTNQRLLFPLLRTDRAEALIRSALPELPWPGQPCWPFRRVCTVAISHCRSITPRVSPCCCCSCPVGGHCSRFFRCRSGSLLGVARAREARWQVDDQSVVLRWRRLLTRNTVIAHRIGAQLDELSSSPWKAKAGVAGFKMRFSSGRAAKIRYMADADALLLLHVVGRRSSERSSPAALGRVRRSD